MSLRYFSACPNCYKLCGGHSAPNSLLVKTNRAIIGISRKGKVQIAYVGQVVRAGTIIHSGFDPILDKGQRVPKGFQAVLRSKPKAHGLAVWELIPNQA